MNKSDKTLKRRAAGHKYSIGVMIDAIVNSYQRSLSEEIINAAADYDAGLIFYLGGRINSGQENEDKLKYIYRLISQKTIDGLIIASNCLISDKQVIIEYVRFLQPLPVINIGFELPGINNIIIDNSEGIRNILHHLVRFHRSRKIAFIGGLENHPDSAERSRAFRNTLRELNIPYDPELYYQGNFEKISGADAVNYFFNVKNKDIDTVVSANDYMAIGAMEALQKMGKKIPGDIRVTGFDNIPDSSFCIPGLTTVSQPFAKIGQKLVESMIKIIEKKEIPDRIILPIELNLRESCGCYPEITISNTAPDLNLKNKNKTGLLCENIVGSLLPEFNQIITEEIKESINGLIESLIDFIKDEKNISRDFFIKWIDFIDKISFHNKITGFLEKLLIEINRNVISHISINRLEFKKINIFFLNAWNILSNKLILLEKSYQYKLEREDVLLLYFRGSTVLGSQGENITTPIQYFVPRLEIQNYFLAKFEKKPGPDFETARIILHQYQNQDIKISKEPFPSNRLIPGGIRSLKIKSNWVVEAISLYNQIGFMVMELSNRNLLIYSQIRTIVSSDFQEHLLFNQFQEQAVSLRKKSEELTSNINYLRKIMGAVIQTLSMIVEAKDPYTAGHERRVADLARTIAAEMGLSYEQMEAVRLSSVVHDIGKLYVPSEILNKPGILLDAEFSLIKLHPKIAFDILKNIEFPWPLADIVYQHHERWDGSGYPQGLKGYEILLESRIIAVADVVEAMASHRPYRPSQGIDAALKEIQDNRGIKYDREIVDICLKLFLEKGYFFKS